MAYRVNHYNKKTGTTYVYEAVSYWDKQATAKDPEVTAAIQIIGPTLILNKITMELGLDKILKKCHPDTFLKLLIMT